MRISIKWLQKYFEEPLPNADTIASAFTLHSFEVERVAGDLMEVDVLPNRAADCLSHRGIATELAAILALPMAHDPLRTEVRPFPTNEVLTVDIEDVGECRRYIGALVRGVRIGQSPTWLKRALESVGQRSVNNVVDATNYVMLDIGQPLHVFDAGKLNQKDGAYGIVVRTARKGEHLTTLSDVEYTLREDMVLVVDKHANEPLSIAGVKGGNVAEVTNETTNIIIEAASFDGPTIRRTAQRLKLFSDASMRFQNHLPSGLAAYGARDVLALITELAGGEVVGVTDVYPTPTPETAVSVTLARINSLLGSHFSREDVMNVFARLGLLVKMNGDTFIVTPPFERVDLTIPEDLIEEAGRVIGYDRIVSAVLPPGIAMPDQAKYYGTERIKDFLVERGFTEISTRAFATEGDISLLNPLDKTIPNLRNCLTQNLAIQDVWWNQIRPQASRFGLAESEVPLFEIGTVFPLGEEELRLGIVCSKKQGGDALDVSKEMAQNLGLSLGENLAPRGTAKKYGEWKLEDSVLARLGKGHVPKKYSLGAYRAFSTYPFIMRDIALWTPIGTETSHIKNSIRGNAGELLVRLDQFDHFEKEGRVSYAFRLIFESQERTLTDNEVNSIMGRISDALNDIGYEVR